MIMKVSNTPKQPNPKMANSGNVDVPNALKTGIRIRMKAKANITATMKSAFIACTPFRLFAAFQVFQLRQFVCREAAHAETTGNYTFQPCPQAIAPCHDSFF
jgi:hypothetical protein